MGGRGILGYHLSTKTKRVYCENVKKMANLADFFSFWNIVSWVSHCLIIHTFQSVKSFEILFALSVYQTGYHLTLNGFSYSHLARTLTTIS